MGERVYFHGMFMCTVRRNLAKTHLVFITKPPNHPFRQPHLHENVKLVAIRSRSIGDTQVLIFASKKHHQIIRMMVDNPELDFAFIQRPFCGMSQLELYAMHQNITRTLELVYLLQRHVPVFSGSLTLETCP